MNNMNNINNALNVLNTNTSASVLPTSSPILLVSLIVVVLAIVGVGAWMTWNAWSVSPWWADRAAAGVQMWDWFPWRTGAASASALSPMGTLEVVDTPAPKPAAPVAQQTSERGVTESWCFVGEDLSGRYCVRVPSERECEPSRYYTSRSACELTPAQHLPAGIQRDGGASMHALSSMRIE